MRGVYTNPSPSVHARRTRPRTHPVIPMSLAAVLCGRYDDLGPPVRL